MKTKFALPKLLLSLFLLTPLAALADDIDDDEYVIIDVERRLLARLEFLQDETTLNETSADTLAALAPMFRSDGLRRFEVHGHFCTGVDGSRAIAMRCAETTVQNLIRRGVSEGDIISLVNPTTRRVTSDCYQDRRVDIMLVERRRVHKSEVPDEPEPIATPEPEPDEYAQPVFSTPRIAPTIPVDSLERQTVAVYMAGEEPQGVSGVHNILGGELARVISESDRYLAVDRTDYIVELLEVEHDYQRSGMVDDDQIRDLGRQLGVQFMCISNITQVGGRRAYYLDVRLVDVETAELVRSVTANSSLRDANEKMRIAREIALELIETDRTLAQRARRKKMFRYIAIGLDVLGAGALAYGYFENGNVADHVDEMRYTDAERAATRRNVGYAVGAALLAGGVTIHIMF